MRMLVTAVVSLLLALTCAQDCPPENSINSRDNPDDFTFTPDGNSAIDLATLASDPTIIKILSTDTGFDIAGSIQPTTLIITSLALEGALFETIALSLRDENGDELFSQLCETVVSEQFSDCVFDLGAGVTGVTTISITVFDSRGEVRVRNLRLEACVETGFCPWSECTATCGAATRARVCECPNPDPDRFVCDPPGPTDETCDLPCCPVEPQWGRWSEYSACDVTCGDGMSTRTRTCEPDAICPDCAGADCLCDGLNTEEETQGCSGGDTGEPEFGPWSEWSECAGECGGSGNRSRTRMCLPAADCPDCDNYAVPCVCDGDAEESEPCADAECTDPLINDEYPYFRTFASSNSVNSYKALIGNGVWKAGISSQFTRWNAKIDKDSCCSIQSISFRFKHVWEVCVVAKIRGVEETVNVKTITRPDDVDKNEWITVDALDLPPDTVKVTLELQPRWYETPTLCDVIVEICCIGEKDVCENEVINNENEDLRLKASENEADAGLALAGSGSYWSSDEQTSWWLASLTNECCGIYSIEFEVYATWEVDIMVKYWGERSFTELQTVNVPMTDGWYKSEVIVLDDNVPEPREVRAVKLGVWAAVDEYDAYLTPKLRNVVITLCCDPEDYSTKPTGIWMNPWWW